MTEETRAKVENRVLQIARLADEICESVSCCEECLLNPSGCCYVDNICEMAVDIQKKRAEKPTYEDLPIDLDDEPKCADGCIYGWDSLECKTCDYKDDDYHCDMCCHPISNGCGLGGESDCPYDLGECCDDNLTTNVGRICFEHNVSTNVAMALIEIIKKERDRNEYLHLYREHIPAE